MIIRHKVIHIGKLALKLTYLSVVN